MGCNLDLHRLIAHRPGQSSPVGSCRAQIIPTGSSPKVVGFLAIGFRPQDCLSCAVFAAFPAPNRTFFAIMAFAVKQMADILLGEPFALVLILLAGLIMYVMNLDRKKQVSTV